MPIPVLASIVEGFGEVQALPVLLRRLLPAWRIATPVRVQRYRVIKPGIFERYSSIARASVTESGKGAILVVLDADQDAPCVLAPALLARARSSVVGTPVHVVLAHRRYEAWLVAGLEVDVHTRFAPDELSNPDDRLEEQFGRYRKSVDQPRLTARMDLDRARKHSPSFDKLMRTLAEIDPEALEHLH